MAKRVPSPLVKLRGHGRGVSSIAYCNLNGSPYLISGDDEGSVLIWDLLTFKKYRAFKSLVKSRILSLRVFGLKIQEQQSKVIAVQSRDHGLHIIDLEQAISADPSTTDPATVAAFPIFESLFSRGDSKNIDENRALLAYPSYLENHLVSIRVLGANAETQISGTARREAEKGEKSRSVFDIILREFEHAGSFLLFVAYEDGFICAFMIKIGIAELEIRQIREIDLNIRDFVSAFDVLTDGPNITAVLGSPLNNLIFLSGPLQPDCEIEPSNIATKRPGVAAIKIRPDKKIVVVAGWDTKVHLYSMKSKKLLVSLESHTELVQDVLFIEKPVIHDSPSTSGEFESSSFDTKHLICCASKDGTISVHDIY